MVRNNNIIYELYLASDNFKETQQSKYNKLLKFLIKSSGLEDRIEVFSFDEINDELRELIRITKEPDDLIELPYLLIMNTSSGIIIGTSGYNNIINELNGKYGNNPDINAIIEAQLLD